MPAPSNYICLRHAITMQGPAASDRKGCHASSLYKCSGCIAESYFAIQGPADSGCSDLVHAASLRIHGPSAEHLAGPLLQARAARHEEGNKLMAKLPECTEYHQISRGMWCQLKWSTFALSWLRSAGIISSPSSQGTASNNPKDLLLRRPTSCRRSTISYTCGAWHGKCNDNTTTVLTRSVCLNSRSTY